MACFAPDCNHTFLLSGCKHLRFPTNCDERKKWIQNVRRSDKDPNESSRLCSCHFVDGKRENGPTIFSWNSKGILPLVPRKNKLKRCNEFMKNSSNMKKLNRGINTDGNANGTISAHKKAEDEIVALRTENNNLRKKIVEMKKPFGIHCISENKRLFLYYTGLTEKVFNDMMNLCSKSTIIYFYGWDVENVDLQNQLLITLMKLRLNLDYLDLSVRFHVTEDTISNIVLTFINTLHGVLCANMLNQTHTTESEVACRMTIGYTVFDTVIPSQSTKEERPDKKHKNTVKGLIAIDPIGMITQCSKLYPGNTPDKVIMKRSGILTKYKNNKLVLIDEGPVSDSELSADDAETHTRTINRLRYFGLLNFIPKPLFVHSNKIFQLCAALTNLMNPESEKSEKSSSLPNSDVVENIEDDDNFIDCTKIKIEEEVDLDEESVVFADDFDDIYCKSEPEDEVTEYCVELDEDM